MLNKDVNHIINNFDFEKVHSVMELLNWTWENDEKAPSVFQLTEMAEYLLNELVKNKEIDYISSGGFRAERVEDYLRLSFEVEEIDSMFYGS